MRVHTRVRKTEVRPEKIEEEGKLPRSRKEGSRSRRRRKKTRGKKKKNEVVDCPI